jgi:exopolyphosphatase/pppGpp-phosphohydrolase
MLSYSLLSFGWLLLNWYTWGVAVLVIPAAVEGRYGHDSAKQALGPRLQTSHILDIGGGSMQVASHERSFGIELGQKSWAHQLCQTLGRDTSAACQLLPFHRLELQQARDLASQELRALSAEVGPGTLTAISRPVTRGIRSALRSLGMAQGESISAQELSTAIDRLSTMALAEVVSMPSPVANVTVFAALAVMKASSVAVTLTAVAVLAVTVA